MESAHIPADLIVVDDTPANLQLLCSMLRDKGYRVRPVTSGQQALTAAALQVPDMVLMDITMPGMDGYTTCQKLKEDTRLRAIPVVFISALNEPLDKVRAFRSGGVDYITKPFNLEEVEARVGLHLELSSQRRALEQKNRQLQELEAIRDDLTLMIVHDMKSPLTALRLIFDLINASSLQADNEVVDILENARYNITTLIDMANQILDVSRFEAGKLEPTLGPCLLNDLLTEACRPFRVLESAKHLHCECPPDLMLTCDAGLLRRVLANLVGNALKFTPQGKSVHVSAHRNPQTKQIRLEIKDQGPGIAKEHQGLLFQKFSQLPGERRNIGTGLGLAFCRMAVECHKGRIGINSEPGHGSIFWLELPQ